MFQVAVFDDEVGGEHAIFVNINRLNVSKIRLFWSTNLAVIFRQSVQWQMKVSTRPSPDVGTSICTAPQKHVAVAVPSFSPWAPFEGSGRVFEAIVKYEFECSEYPSLLNVSACWD
jgi:hypothetical protein